MGLKRMLCPTIDVLWIARYDYPAGWGLKSHRHHYFQMIYFLDGNGVFTVDRQEYPIRGGHLFLIRPGQNHALRAGSPVRTLDVKFRIPNQAASRRLSKAAPYVALQESGLSAMFERIRMEGERKGPYCREMCSLLLGQILLLYLRQQGQADADPEPAPLPDTAIADDLLRRAVAHIRQNFSSPLTVGDLARALGCTDRAVRLHFSRTLQTRPLLYLQRYRIERAKEMMEYSGYTLKQIAEMAGFRTVQHFTRVFGEIEGRTPAAWRKQYLDGINKDVYIDPRFSSKVWTVKLSKT
jgi:AraC-like DNA-binding protein